MTTKEEIIADIKKDITVFWKNLSYKVILKKDDLYIIGHGSMTYLEERAYKDCFSIIPDSMIEIKDDKIIYK